MSDGLALASGVLGAPTPAEDASAVSMPSAAACASSELRCGLAVVLGATARLLVRFAFDLPNRRAHNEESQPLEDVTGARPCAPGPRDSGVKSETAGSWCVS